MGNSASEQAAMDLKLFDMRVKMTKTSQAHLDTLCELMSFDAVSMPEDDENSEINRVATRDDNISTDNSESVHTSIRDPGKQSDDISHIQTHSQPSPASIIPAVSSRGNHPTKFNEEDLRKRAAQYSRRLSPEALLVDAQTGPKLTLTVHHASNLHQKIQATTPVAFVLSISGTPLYVSDHVVLRTYSTLAVWSWEYSVSLPRALLLSEPSTGPLIITLFCVSPPRGLEFHKNTTSIKGPNEKFRFLGQVILSPSTLPPIKDYNSGHVDSTEMTLQKRSPRSHVSGTLSISLSSQPYSGFVVPLNRTQIYAELLSRSIQATVTLKSLLSTSCHKLLASLGKTWTVPPAFHVYMLLKTSMILAHNDGIPLPPLMTLPPQPPSINAITRIQTQHLAHAISSLMKSLMNRLASLFTNQPKDMNVVVSMILKCHSYLIDLGAQSKELPELKTLLQAMESTLALACRDRYESLRSRAIARVGGEILLESDSESFDDESRGEGQTVKTASPESPLLKSPTLLMEQKQVVAKIEALAVAMTAVQIDVKGLPKEYVHSLNNAKVNLTHSYSVPGMDLASVYYTHVLQLLNQDLVTTTEKIPLLIEQGSDLKPFLALLKTTTVFTQSIPLEHRYRIDMSCFVPLQTHLVRAFSEKLPVWITRAISQDTFRPEHDGKGSPSSSVVDLFSAMTQQSELFISFGRQIQYIEVFIGGISDYFKTLNTLVDQDFALLQRERLKGKTTTGPPNTAGNDSPNTLSQENLEKYRGMKKKIELVKSKAKKVTEKVKNRNESVRFSRDLGVGEERVNVEICTKINNYFSVMERVTEFFKSLPLPAPTSAGSLPSLLRLRLVSTHSLPVSKPYTSKLMFILQKHASQTSSSPSAVILHKSRAYPQRANFTFGEQEEEMWVYGCMGVDLVLLRQFASNSCSTEEEHEDNEENIETVGKSLIVLDSKKYSHESEIILSGYSYGKVLVTVFQPMEYASWMAGMLKWAEQNALLYVNDITRRIAALVAGDVRAEMKNVTKKFKTGGFAGGFKKLVKDVKGSVHKNGAGSSGGINDALDSRMEYDDTASARDEESCSQDARTRTGTNSSQATTTRTFSSHLVSQVNELLIPFLTNLNTNLAHLMNLHDAVSQDVLLQIWNRICGGLQDCLVPPLEGFYADNSIHQAKSVWNGQRVNALECALEVFKDFFNADSMCILFL